jgi:hypothetical protein
MSISTTAFAGGMAVGGGAGGPVAPAGPAGANPLAAKSVTLAASNRRRRKQEINEG